MSDQPNSPQSSPGPGQDQGAPSGQPPEGGDQGQPFVLTQKQYEADLARVADEAFRRAQSFTDKANQRVQERLNTLDQTFKTLDAAGVKLTPEQQALARTKAWEEAQSEPGSGQPSGQEPPAPEGEVDPLAEELYTWANDYMQTQGVDLNDDDPEVEQFKLTDLQDPFEWSWRVKQAVEAKKTRTSSQQATPGAARTPANVGGSNVPPSTVAGNFDADSLWEQTGISK